MGKATEQLDGRLGPETIRALRDYLAEDAARKIIAAVLASGQYTRTEAIALLRSITANPDVLDRITEQETR